MAYGLAIYNQDTTLKQQFSEPIAALQVIYITGTSGSITVPGVYAHAEVHITPLTTYGVFQTTPQINVYLDDVITWSPAQPPFSTTAANILYLVFGK